MEHAALNTSLPSVLVVTRACRPSLVVATMAKPGGMARFRSRKPAAQSVCSPSTHSYVVLFVGIRFGARCARDGRLHGKPEEGARMFKTSPSTKFGFRCRSPTTKAFKCTLARAR